MTSGLNITEQAPSTTDADSETPPSPSDADRYHEHATYGEADLFRLRDIDCIGRFQHGAACTFSARYVGIRDAADAPRIAGFCALHAPESWVEGADTVGYPLFDLDEDTCRATVTEEAEGVHAPPMVDSCPYTPFIAIRGMEAHWRHYCKIHSRDDFLLALSTDETVEL